MNNVTEINNLSELLLELRKFKIICDFQQEEKLFFRGQSNKNFELAPSIGRYPNECIDDSLSWFESEMYEEARNAFLDEFSNKLNPIDFLAKLQHYGIPTRLLDITEDPLVALYFACSDQNFANYDGELFVFKNKDYKPTFNAISEAVADTAYIPEYNLNVFLKYVMSKSYFDNDRQALINKLEEDPNYGNSWVAKCCETPFFVHRSFLTNRQQIQKGSFLLFSNEIKEDGNTGEKYFNDKIKPIDKGDKNIVLHRFIIPSSSKKEILTQLNELGINRRSLFADSIDIVCEEIKKHYMIDRFKKGF